MTARILGWDIGGAHLKLAVVEDGVVVAARLLPCATWRGVAELRQAMMAALDGMPQAARHAVTMTGELADAFADRPTGVAAILDLLAECVPAERIAVYGVAGEYLSVAAARAQPDRVASANWHASALYLAQRLTDGLLIDIGSTTTDIVPLRHACVASRGQSDAERLATGELVYTGVARTPLAAMARRIPFAGRSTAVMGEFFATSADAHRLAGTLPDGADLHPAADNRGKTLADSRARIARMVGMDAAAAPDEAWRGLAAAFLRRQINQIEEAVDLVLSCADLPPDAPLVGAGTGRFIAAEIARRLRRPYRGFDETLRLADCGLASLAIDIAPAIAVALLLRDP
jgi:(4-(4-[2-(gamma-L-glutamylamino)ethyl]phenoxymethyl)furan-2-yl)methanamine synthase